MHKKLVSIVGAIGLALLVAGCGQPTQPADASQGNSSPRPTQATVAQPQAETPPPTVEDVETANSEPQKDEATMSEQAKQTAALPQLPAPENQLADGEYRWSQLLARDSIAPIYDPKFAPAAQAAYDDEELVIGVEINGQAKAYAIGPLNSREMVNDTVGGTPVLVTW